MIQASPDLQDLELASGGKLLPLLRQVFLTPLPLETKALLAGSTGQPLLEQALHAATQVVDLEGVELDESGRMLTEALIRAERRGQPNILGFLRELPGEQASIDLSRLAEVANRLKTNLEEGVGLARSVEVASETAALRVVGVMSKAALSTSATASDVAGLLHQAEGMRVVPWVQIHCTTTQLRFFYSV